MQFLLVSFSSPTSLYNPSFQFLPPLPPSLFPLLPFLPSPMDTLQSSQPPPLYSPVRHMFLAEGEFDGVKEREGEVVLLTAAAAGTGTPHGPSP